MSTTLRVGWIGTGVMGLSMAGHILKAGFPLTVYSRTRSKSQPLLDKGAHWADDPAVALFFSPDDFDSPEFVAEFAKLARIVHRPFLNSEVKDET